jgi:hypothetical protein
MKTETIRSLVIIFVLLTLFGSMLMPAGQPHFRLKERIEVMQAYTLNPSASTKAALDDEFARLHHHEATTGIILIPLVLLVDVAVIYFFWNCGRRKTTA